MKKNTRCLLALVFFLHIVCIPASASNWLFVLFDAGETNGLIPVIQLLQGRENEQVTVMAEGASVSILHRKKISHVRLADFAENGLMDFQVPADKLAFDHNTGPYISLRHVSVKEIPHRVLRKINPDAIITGLVSQYEDDFLKAANEAGIPSFGFFDFYDVPGKNSIFARLCPRAGKILVSTSDIAKGIATAGIKAESDILVTGHPNFSRLCELKETFNREITLTKAGLDPEKRYFTFTTQYSPGNDELLTLLARVMESMSMNGSGNRSDLAASTETELIIAPHPNQDPHHYLELAKTFGIPCHLLDRSKISVYEAMMASDMIFTQSSTTGFEAILLDKPLIHILPSESDPQAQFNVRKELALWAKAEKELIEAIADFKGEKGKQIRKNRSIVKPIPHADRNILDEILKVIGKGEKSNKR